MAYTPSPSKSRSGTRTTFGNQSLDASRVPMQVGSRMQSQDNAATPVISPAPNMSGSGQELKVPDTAISMTIVSSVAIQVGEDSSYAQGLTVPANVPMSFDCAKQAFIYLKPSSATNTVSFQFNCI